ncbi:F-box-like domain superfamily [Arabidopsis suecica]|uniref:F-box-like domain superfamily n=1 Tax=Arabidopsis suecica TaxID=45249 RepID=A0A8T2AK53_ARASU|nr:F-box-like domain superfamily [Arabidopsis suecica]
MADDGGNGDGATAGDCYAHHHRRDIKLAGDSSENLDSISSLPDVILQQILSYLPTNLAIRTSVLSTRWRHVWYDTPSLYFDGPGTLYRGLKADTINKTLARYKLPKIMSFHLYTNMLDNVPYIDDWIEFAISRNVENLSLDCGESNGHGFHSIPEFIYTSSSVKQLSLRHCHLIPRCALSWTSLKNLSLHTCSLCDEFFAKTLCGFPFLESLKLFYVLNLMVLDLSKSLRLKTLEIYSYMFERGPMQIVAPHIHSLKLTKSKFSCTLVDVSSLTEATVEAIPDVDFRTPKQPKTLQVMTLKMLEKLQNVEKLTLGANFLKLLSIAKVQGLSFPMFKAKALTLETTMYLCVTPGVKDDLLYNFDPRGLNPDQRCCRCWVFERTLSLKTKHVASFMKIILKNTKTLEKMVVRLKDYLEERGFEELLQIVPLLSLDNNINIVLS